MTHALRAFVLVLLPFLTLHPAARHRPGPIFLRGVAQHVSGGGFTLLTSQHGAYRVLVTADTAVTDKGVPAHLGNGDHVGVHGFATGRTLRAIYVHIYLHKPTPFSVRGTVSAIGRDSLTIREPAASITVAVTAQTTILIGSAPGSLRAIHVGDKVDVRAEASGGRTIALHIHVYRHKLQGTHVEVTGTVTAVGNSAVDVRGAAGAFHIRLVAATIIYVGRSLGTVRDLHSGQTVRVYACCAGSPLVAHSIHIETSRQRVVAVVLKGIVAALSPAALRLTDGRQVSLTVHTAYEVGTAAVSRTGIEIGDHVSIRAVRQGASLVALRVHVYASFRRPRTVTGIVSRIADTDLTVPDRGRIYTVTAGSHVTVTLNGNPAAFSAIRVGDHLRAVGRLRGSVLTARSIVARRLPPHLTTVRGALVSVHGARFTIRDASGVSHAVRLGPGVKPRWNGRPAPAAVLFPGVHISAKGVVEGRLLVASRVTVTATAGSASGRITAVSAHRLTLGTRHVLVDLPASAGLTDGGEHIAVSVLRVGTYVHVSGFTIAAHHLRAVDVTVDHPLVDISGAVTAVSPLTMRTSSGETYVLVLQYGVSITTEHTLLPVPAGELAPGTRIHAHGTMNTDGTLGTDLVQVRLPSVSVRATVTSVTAGELTLSDGDRVAAGTEVSVTQGSRSLTLADIVTGDDVTVEGYRARDVVLARRILVHRRLVGVDGVITSLTNDGFLMTVAGRQMAVIVSTATDESVQPAAGQAVHVTGYQRGDGSILATRIRAGAAKHGLALELACPRLFPSRF
ncbi:MAG TPA: DUF5666 domain-containing protein [Chloroflexota bacterium]|nr:DUF5666 domain-containing protein [Chloroflexota bacterium]